MLVVVPVSADFCFEFFMEAAMKDSFAQVKFTGRDSCRVGKSQFFKPTVGIQPALSPHRALDRPKSRTITTMNEAKPSVILIVGDALNRPKDRPNRFNDQGLGSGFSPVGDTILIGKRPDGSVAELTGERSERGVVEPEVAQRPFNAPD